MTDFANSHRIIRASAGSGKTHQLTNRYLSLLAAGVEPNAILATTFTRKAAGEILERVLLRLSKAAGDPDSARELANQLGVSSGQPEFAALLAQLLRNIHSLRSRISTLDSFYMALGRSFDFELGMPPGWQVGEDIDEQMQSREALEGVLQQQPEDVARILPLLNKGESTRSVHEEILRTTAALYEVYCGSPKKAWELPNNLSAIASSEIHAALDALRHSTAAEFKDKKFDKARNDDIGRFERQDWSEFLKNGIAKKVHEKETSFNRKEIPEEILRIYQTLIAHVRSEVHRRLAEQTKATRDLLDHFHRELTSQKQISGLLRFADVTNMLVSGLQGGKLQASRLGFRLDGAVEHLLLDEFQDTSFSQWQVIEPLAEAITKSNASGQKSFFCVGDVKQAIYAWRGGLAAILNLLPDRLGTLLPGELTESRRSAQPIMDAVNQVFGNLSHIAVDEKYRAGLEEWSKRFVPHTTVKQSEPGYFALYRGPTRQDGEPKPDFAERCDKNAARLVQSLSLNVPQASIGVLCRTNETVANMIHELRNIQVEASEEGGNPLTDSPAVELILSLFTLADHPDHSIAWFHLRNSPLSQVLPPGEEPESFARQLRRDILKDGYAAFTEKWTTRLEEMLGPCSEARNEEAQPAEDGTWKYHVTPRDLQRLRQLVKLAGMYQPRGTLRAADFVAWVRAKKVPDPSDARVKVMTIHGAKGLEFDIVVLPELDASLVGGFVPKFVVGRDPKTLEVNLVCRYASEAEQGLLDDNIRQAFAQDRQQRVEESLSLLYVAMTRARNALYMIIPEKLGGRTGWHHLLREALAPHAESNSDDALHEHGDPSWWKKLHPSEAAKRVDEEAETVSLSQPIRFAKSDNERRRGLQRIAPSSREGQGQVPLSRLFHPSEGTGMAAGTLYHAWFESIAWLDDGVPKDAELRAIALRLRTVLPMETWRNLDQLLASFRRWLAQADVNAVLRRSAYTSPQQPGFPGTLESLWTKSITPQKVERERQFLVRDGESFLNGSLDRVIWLGNGDRIVAADVIDFKTDDISPGDDNALAARTEHYRPQMETYRQAVARMADLKPESVSIRLVFAAAGRVVDTRSER